MGHPHGILGAFAVGDPEHLVAHDIPAARLLPHRGGMHGGKEEFLTADGVHLFAHDALDLGEDAPSERKQ